MCVYVGTQVCRHVGLYVCVCMYMFVCICMYLYVSYVFRTVLYVFVWFVCICMYLYGFVCVCIDMYLYVCILLFTSGWEIVGVFDWHTHIMIRRKWWGGMELGAMVTFTCTCTHTWCYTTRNFDMHLCTYLMLRYKWGGVGWAGLGAGKFYLYCPRTWCYARECSLTLAHVLLCFIANGVWAGQVIEKRLSCSLRRRIKASESDTTKHLHSQGWQKLIHCLNKLPDGSGGSRTVVIRSPWKKALAAGCKL